MIEFRSPSLFNLYLTRVESKETFFAFVSGSFVPMNIGPTISTVRVPWLSFISPGFLFFPSWTVSTMKGSNTDRNSFDEEGNTLLHRTSLPLV
jgi:hypothetical protein